MRAGTSRIRLSTSALPITIAIAIGTLLPTAGRTSEEGTPPAAEVLTTLDFTDELQWYYRNDVGILLIYADGQLHRLDLLADEPKAQAPLSFPDLTTERSVLPVARTGLLLVPNASLGGKPRGSHAIDTVTGELLWQAPALPGIDQLFSFPDAGLAVLRSPDNGGRLIAVDLMTGDRVWEIAKWARMIWTDAPYLRVMVENSLLTVDTHTGETIREDDVTLPKSDRLHVFHEEGIYLLWNNREFVGYSVPPAPPASKAPPRQLWEFKAGSLMIGTCIKMGNCRINRVGDDFLFVRSAQKNELIRLTTGELIASFKKGMFGSPVSVSPTGKHIAYAAGGGMQILDGSSGKLTYEIKYPKGGEGMKTLRYLTWPTDDLVMTVFPDKKGNPRKMTGFSCTEGLQVWSTVLPDVADYSLTSKQKSVLVGRIITSLIMTAASATNPVAAGGSNYYAVFVPDLNVSASYAAGMAPIRSGEAGTASPFEAALERHAECERRIAPASEAIRYFFVGPKTRYDLLEIDLVGGGVRQLMRYQAGKVHAIAPFNGFERAVTIENNNTRVRLLRIPG